MVEPGKTAFLHLLLPSTEEIGPSETDALPPCQDQLHLGCQSLNSWENGPCMTLEIPQIQQAAKMIKHTWLASRDRKIFKMLKHAICAAENCMTEIFLRRVSPREADLLQDPAFPARVRLRFGGSNFPPMIFFKIFHQHNGPGVKYISGKQMIKASSEATEDSLKMMGNRIFYENILRDSMQEHYNRITDEVNVITLKDYMQYLANLDETPAKFGGKSNFWRLLTLDDVPRHTIFYDIVEFLYIGKLSRHLQQQLPNLLLKPVTPEIQLQHLKIISALRCSVQPSYYRIPQNLLSNFQSTKRRSKQAIERVSKMKELYKHEKKESLNSKDVCVEPQYGSHVSLDLPVDICLENSSSISTLEICPLHSLSSPAENEYDMNEWDREAYQLYKWTQQLSVDNLISTPRLPT